jgi:D-3-phosphoglycerate dehydrogenase
LAKVGAELVIARTGSEGELLSLAPQADAILTCFAQVPAAVLRAGPRLQVVSRYGIGVDNVDVAEATRLGILVTNVPDYCVDEVSDHAMALILASARKIRLYDAAVRRGDSALQTGVPIHRLHGTTLGLLGFGKVGQLVAWKAHAFGLYVIAHDPYIQPAAVVGDAEFVALDDLLERADYLSIHAPLTAETRGLIGEQRLRQMKRTSVIINTARAPIIDQAALVRALQQGWISGAALDVYEEDCMPPGQRLSSLPNVILTPHVAFYSEEALIDLQTRAAENVARVLTGHKPTSLVNPQVLGHQRRADLT